MKKHKDMKLIENEATVDMFNIIRKYNGQKIEYLYIKELMTKNYQKYNVVGWENNKYYKELIGHAEKNLKKEKFISVEGRADQKVYTKEENIRAPEPFENIEASNISWDTKQSISNIYDFVGSNNHLIPYFQRGTAWTKSKDYIELAYSIFRSVPLGIMYLWKIDKKTAIEIKHNKFKRDILISDNVTNFETININEMDDGDIYSVIDGQQRITGINVIINGTFDGKKLYFNEKQPGAKKFKFYKEGPRVMWNSIENIYSALLKIKNLEKITPKNLLNDRKRNEMKKIAEEMFISLESLNSFYNGFFASELIAICELPNIELTEILQVFVRTNQFGKKLNPTDIMMSYIVGNDTSTRDKITEVYNAAKSFKSNIKLSTILKLVSVIFNNKAKISPSKFRDINKRERLNGIMDVNDSKSWDKICDAFGQLLKITSKADFDNKWIKSENSIIPIIYWIIYKNNNKLITSYKVKNEINNYLLIAQLSRVFRSSTDQRLDFIISNLKEDFSKWKFDIDKKETIEVIKKEISSYKYGSNNSEIKILLMSLTKIFDESDSIEHIVAQNNGGSDYLFNLSMLPKRINSGAKDKTINEKVEYLAKAYEISKKEVMERLMITNSNIEKDSVNRKRLDTISKAISKHLI